MLSKPRMHVFVCTNWRAPGGRTSCGGQASLKVLRALQLAVLSDETLRREVMVTGCECFSLCFEGPNVVVYPEGVWYAGVNPDDVGELVESHLKRGTPIKRLMHTPQAVDE